MKNLWKPTREKIDSFLRKAEKATWGVGTGLMTIFGLAMPASAGTTINTGATTETVIGGILDVVFKVAMYMGIVIAVIGVVSFILAFKDDNAESQSRGIRLAIVGTALIGMKTLIKLTGLIN